MSRVEIRKFYLIFQKYFDIILLTREEKKKRRAGTQVKNLLDQNNTVLDGLPHTTYMKNIKMSAPWYVYFEQLKALFEQDDEVDLDIIEEDEGYKIEIFVEDDIKAEAIAKLLPEKKVFGNVEVPIYVYPNNSETDAWIESFADAFEGNPIIENILPFSGPTHDQNFVVFKKEVVQYYSDNIQSLDGVTSTVYEDIARDVFKDAPAGVFFSTAIDE